MGSGSRDLGSTSWCGQRGAGVMATGADACLQGLGKKSGAEQALEAVRLHRGICCSLEDGDVAVGIISGGGGAGSSAEEVMTRSY